MTVTLTIEEIEDYRRRMLLWSNERLKRLTEIGIELRIRGADPVRSTDEILREAQSFENSHPQPRLLPNL